MQFPTICPFVVQGIKGTLPYFFCYVLLCKEIWGNINLIVHGLSDNLFETGVKGLPKK